MSTNAPYILVAEDDPDDQLILQTAFREMGYRENLLFVNDGNELLAHLSVNTQKRIAFPGLILLDLNMPRKDGREALTEIKQDDNLKQIPVIVFSTTADKKEINNCYQLGANSYIVKPNGYDGLKKAVDAIHSYWFQTASTAFNMY